MCVEYTSKIAVANDEKAHRRISELPQSSGGFQKQFMILDFRESANDANQNIVFISLQFCARDRTTFFPIGVHAHVDAEWDHGELFGCSDAKAFVYLPTLLMAYHDDPIGYQARQTFLDGQKQPRLPRAVVAVKNVPMISMDEATRARFSKQGGGRQPAIDQSSYSANGARFGRVGVHDGGLFAQHQAKEFPDGECIFW